MESNSELWILKIGFKKVNTFDWKLKSPDISESEFILTVHSHVPAAKSFEDS